MSHKDKRKKGIVGIDYLQYILDSQFLIGAEGVEQILTYDEEMVLVREEGETPLFKSRYTLCLEGYAVADVLTHPKNEQINKVNHVSIRISNHMLYSSDLWSVFDRINDALGGRVNNITRLDLFCDTQGILPYATQFNRGLLNLKTKLKTRSILNNKAKVETIYIGSKSSDKYTKIYDKSRELQSSNKKYISNIWDQQGIDQKEGHVHRMEITLKSQVFLKLPEFDVRKLRHKIFLIRLFCTEVASQIQFYKPQKKKRPHQCKSIDIRPKNLQYIKPLKKTKKQASKVVFRKKIHIKSQVEEFITNQDSKYGMQQALSLAIDYGLEKWFHDKIHGFIDHFEKSIPPERRRPPDDYIHALAG